MFAGILAFFASAFGKVLLALGVGTAIFSTVAFLYVQHNNLVKAEALAEFNSKQLAQVQKDNEQLTQSMNDLQAEKDSLTKDILTQNQALDTKLKPVEQIIAAGQDRPASKLLIDTIRSLQQL